ncbi:MAG TPA: PIN domain-containing protein [Candidatus Nanoarchaeia archaeon]|nr:PIN domain-containing protein [Candidatus Nanoarchaeia archaeon]
MQYFLDTYALIEIFLGNENYKNYIFDPEQAMCTIFNLMEAHFYFLKKFGQTKSDEIYELIKPIIVKIDDSTLKEANRFKLLHLKKRLSFADCIGYITSLKLNAKFITGDYAFKEMKNVEFIK